MRHSHLLYVVFALFLIVLLSNCDRPSPCDGFECNYGNCVVSPDGTPKCDCYPGYFGENCPYENYDPCLVMECKNGGTCEVDPLNARIAHCNCLPGFKGAHCEVADPCYNNNGGCINGTCRDSLGLVICDCLPGFTGIHCENVDHCYNITCSPNATCDTETGECECLTGYEFAPTCEQQIRAKFLGQYAATDNCEGTITNYTCRILPNPDNIQEIIIRNLGDRDSINVKARIFNTNKFIITQNQEFTYTSVPPHDTIMIVVPPIIYGTLTPNPDTGDTTINLTYNYAFPGEVRVFCNSVMVK